MTADTDRGRAPLNGATKDGPRGEGVQAALGTSVLRRVLLGLGSVGLGQIIAASQSILFVPLFLHAWGQHVYGGWLALTALISYLSLLDLGGQNYVQNLLTIDYAHGNLEAFRVKMCQGVSLFIAIAGATLAALTVFLFAISPRIWREGTGPFAMHGAPWIVLLSATALLLTIPGGVYVTVYRAMGLFVRGQMLGNAIRVCELIGYAALLALRVSPVGFAGFLLLAALVRTTIVTVDIYWNTPAPRVSVSPRAAWQGRVYLKGSLMFWLMSLSTALNQQGVLLVVTSISGPAAVAVYATHRTASGLIGYLGMMTMAPLWPEFSRLWATNRSAEVRHMALLALRTVLLTSGLAALFLWIALPVIYPVWTGRHLHLNSALLAIFLVQAVLYAGWSTTSWSLMAANRQRLPAIWSLANACMTIVLALWWGRTFGLAGVAAGSLCGDLLCGLAVFPVLASRFLNMHVARMYLALFQPAAWLLPLGAALLCTTRILPSGPAMVLCAALTCLWLVPAGRFAVGEAGMQYLEKFARGRKGALSR